METNKTEIAKDQDGLRQTQKRICFLAMTAALVVGAVVFLLFHERAIAKGLILGTCFSVINFSLLAKSIPMTLGRSRSKARLIGLASVLFRYMLLAIPLVVAIRTVSFDFFAVVFGILAVQIVTLADYIIIKPIQRWKVGL